MPPNKQLYARLNPVTTHFVNNTEFLYACRVRGTLDEYWVQTRSKNEFDPSPTTCNWDVADLTARPDLKLHAACPAMIDNVMIYESTMSGSEGMLWVKALDVFSEKFASRFYAFHEAFDGDFSTPMIVTW